jgi:hypothetical protein
MSDKLTSDMSDLGFERMLWRELFIHKSIALFLRAFYEALCCGGCGIVDKKRC